MARFANAATDAALAEGRASTDEAARNEAYQAFEKEWNANVPDIWLARTDWMIASDKTVHGYLPAAQRQHRQRHPQDVGRQPLDRLTSSIG